MKPSLPEGWAWAPVSTLAEAVEYGSSTKTSPEPGGVPVLRMGNLVSGSIVTDALKYLPMEHDEFPKLLLTSGDVLFNRTNSAELVGKSAVYEGTPAPCSFASYLLRVRLSESYRPRLLAYYINSVFGRAWVRRMISQQVGQANVNGTKLKALEVPVPPEHEQRRIVAKIESLFERSRRAKAALDAIPPLLDKLRQSILAAAFRGDLTADWRAQNPDAVPPSGQLHEWKPRGGRLDAAKLTANETAKSLDECPASWGRCRLGEGAHFFYGFAYKRTQFSPTGMRLLRGANIGIGKTKWENAVFAPPSLCEAKYALEPNDIVIAMDRPFITGGFRVARISPADCPSSLVQRVARLRRSDAVSTDYLYCFLLSAAFERHLKARVTGSSVPHVSGIDLGSAWMPLPSLGEQAAIADKVSDALGRLDAFAQLTARQAAKASKLDASVLAKAFRGELVEQDPDDEPASVLLERIRAAREAATPVKKKRGRKRRVGGKKTALVEAD